jgi:molybdate transport system substrate-binding protein
MLTRRHVAALVTAAIMLVSLPQAQAKEKITVFAAASLKTALDAVNAAWTAETGNEATISYAASSALAKQIEQGAPADVFISADLDWMAYLTDKSLIIPGSAINLLGNDIVLIAPTDSKLEIAVSPGFPLADALGEGKLAMADVKAVPAGKYGKSALEQLGVWTSVEGKVAQAENVRAALKLVATGEATLGIVYATDARAEPAVKVIGTFPADSHKPIIYPVALVASSSTPSAADFVKFLESEKAASIFTAQGFTVLVPPATN